MAKKKAEKELVAEVVAEPVVTEEQNEVSARERFIMRKLAVINKMSDSAKAQRLAARVLMNNRKG